MAARIITVSQGKVWWPEDVERCWFFPHGSEFLRYAPHFHVIHGGGFRQNLPLNHMFVVVMDGKVSIKDYWGKTFERIDVLDQVWHSRSTKRKAPQTYRKTLFQGVHRRDQRRDRVAVV